MTSGKALWIDLETTGLSPATDVPLQIAGFVADVDGTGEINGTEFSYVMRHSADEAQQWRDKANNTVRRMHDRTGLWDALPAGITVADADERIATMIDGTVNHMDRLYLAGNSIGALDRPFIEAFFPKLASRLHYQMVDVTSFRLIARTLGIPDYRKESRHEALSDIRESAAELAYLIEALTHCDHHRPPTTLSGN